MKAFLIIVSLFSCSLVRASAPHFLDNQQYEKLVREHNEEAHHFKQFLKLATPELAETIGKSPQLSALLLKIAPKPKQAPSSPQHIPLK